MTNWIISSSILIITVIVLRSLFKGKISLRLQYALWFLVAVRLLIPVNFGSSAISIENLTNHLSMQPQIESTVENIIDDYSRSDYENAVKIYEEVKPTAQTSEDIPSEESFLTPESASANIFSFADTLSQIVFYVWILGIVVFCLIFVISNIYFGRKVKRTRQKIDVPYSKLPVYVSNVVDTPCLFGMIRPTIYVTKAVSENSMILRHSVYHEMTHYKQGDLFWTIVRCACLALHWYNPLVWWAAKLSKQDAELACDEATISKLGENERLEYGKTLILLTCEKRQDLFITATTMTSEGKSIKERIKLISKKPKIAAYALIIIVLTTLIAVGCTFTSAEEEKMTVNEESTSDAFVVPQPEEEAAPTVTDTTNAEKIIAKADERLREGYVEATLTYVDNAEVGWDYYSDNPWSSDEERDALAQAAVKELYTLTGYNLKECVYTTDGRSTFIFGKSAEFIRKCIAFYSRDYGFTLCGNSMPYTGFVNARRAHYSDVQQLDSPYGKAEFSGHGAIPAWFLEHSGIYQGEKIMGFDAFKLDDTVYTHIKLLFEGGYYVVVMDEGIESVHEVMGPYESMPVLMVNGSLYYGTDEVGPMGDSGAVAGYIESSVDENYTPTKNGESNFGCIGNPYTYGDSSIQVLMDDGEYHWFYLEDLIDFTIAKNSETYTSPTSSSGMSSATPVEELIWVTDQEINWTEEKETKLLQFLESEGWFFADKISFISYTDDSMIEELKNWNSLVEQQEYNKSVAFVSVHDDSLAKKLEDAGLCFEFYNMLSSENYPSGNLQEFIPCEQAREVLGDYIAYSTMTQTSDVRQVDVPLVFYYFEEIANILAEAEDSNYKFTISESKDIISADEYAQFSKTVDAVDVNTYDSATHILAQDFTGTWYDPQAGEAIRLTSEGAYVYIPNLEKYGDTLYEWELIDRSAQGLTPELAIYMNGKYSGPLSYYVTGFREDYFCCSGQAQTFYRQ